MATATDIIFSGTGTARMSVHNILEWCSAKIKNGFEISIFNFIFEIMFLQASECNAHVLETTGMRKTVKFL